MHAVHFTHPQLASQLRKLEACLGAAEAVPSTRTKTVNICELLNRPIVYQ